MEGEPPKFEPFPEERIKSMEELEIDTLTAEEMEEMEEVAMAPLATDGDLQQEIRDWIKDNEVELPGYEQKEGLWLKEGRIWVPPEEELRRKVVELYHDSPFTGHLGIAGTMDLVGKGYYWGDMQQYI